MAHDLNFPIEIVVCPIVREPDGLAMSSRNAYLNPDQRRAATVLYRALKAAETAHDAGRRHAETLRRLMEEAIAGEPLARLQYASCADPDTLQELEGPVDRALLSLAVFIGDTRLIDNMIVASKTEVP
jgi:pantoate--beta-alanine ligase